MKIRKLVFALSLICQTGFATTLPAPSPTPSAGPNWYCFAIILDAGGQVSTAPANIYIPDTKTNQTVVLLQDTYYKVEFIMNKGNDSGTTMIYNLFIDDIDVGGAEVASGSFLNSGTIAPYTLFGAHYLAVVGTGYVEANCVYNPDPNNQKDVFSLSSQLRSRSFRLGPKNYSIHAP